jgi:hypothetical protein
MIPCGIKQLPDDQLDEAAKVAIDLNPANMPVGVIPPGKIAVLTSKYFGPSGVHLTVGFMGSISEALAKKILQHMNSWNDYANVSFVPAPVASAQVRIAFENSGYWSYLGSDVLQIPKNQPTMNLQGFNTTNVRDSEYYRVVRHETGHTLGCPHEHMRRSIVSKLDRQKTIAYFRQTQGWSEQDVIQQVLTPIEETKLTGTPVAETDSIMCYGLPGSITVDGVAIPGGVDITPDDGAFIGKIYPKAITPSPPLDWLI